MLNMICATEGSGVDFVQILENFWKSMGLSNMTWQQWVMIAVAFVLLYLAIVKKFEPLLLLPIAFGMFVVNIPGAKDVLLNAPVYQELIDPTTQQPVLDAAGNQVYTNEMLNPGGLLYYLSKGVEWVIFPPLIFLGIGAMTDFGPMIANPKTMLLGAAAQLGIFITLIGAILLGFDPKLAAAVGIIGGADGPTAIYVAMKLYATYMPVIAIAAYSYMALIPVIQPPLMRLIVPKRERVIRMEQLRPVSKVEKVVFPLLVTLVVGVILPPAMPLLGMLMLGNLMKESGVVDRISKTAQNELINIVTIFLGICVGAKAAGEMFLQPVTLLIIVLGLVAFMFGTVGGLLLGRLMCKLTHGKVNPLIGSAGVSAVPMAARVSQKIGQEEDPNNYLLMHAMGPNVAGVIGSAIAAGVMLAIFA